ncbi:hypothetical protein M2100_002188, partial [Breznakia sp. PFB2-30]|nr:hypothetical protein [Breznakia sp. PF1-11]MDH6415248.1 hypothetical protein [Breznakia sp. PFB1-14]MDH6474987.1 hypothetical protein [Breznakia sp. PFB2-30]
QQRYEYLKKKTYNHFYSTGYTFSAILNLMTLVNKLTFF